MQKPATKRPILVVEDDEDTSAALRMLLADEGYPSVSVPDVRNAVASLESLDPGLLLLDWSLDGGSGEAVLTAARRPDAAHPPVVLMTGNCMVSRRPSATVDAVLRKPFDAGELLDLVARFYKP